MFILKRNITSIEYVDILAYSAKVQMNGQAHFFSGPDCIIYQL